MLGGLIILILRRLVPDELLDLDAQRAAVDEQLDELAGGRPCDFRQQHKRLIPGRTTRRQYWADYRAH